MATGALETKPVQFRLPAWAREFLDEQSRQAGTTKTEVVVEAIECLRDKELAALMAEGYRELADLNEELAEESIGIAGEALPEWD
jgi:predicted DNA-binding protein